MCGITGFQGSFDPGRLKKMAEMIAHRGPDDSGNWFSAEYATGLAHRRLSIIDLSPFGHQPMWDASNTAVIVFNGEIYNFRELRGDLKKEGYRFFGGSDTEVLVALYKSRGEAMLPMLNGIFAFAIYDQTNQTLFLACDAMAVKPLYYAQTAAGFVFSSELKSLLACGSVSKTIDVVTLFRTLGFLWSPGGTTPLKDVQRLGPGEALRVRNKQIIRGWRWAEPAWPAQPLQVGASEAIDRVRKGVRTAVQRQLVADVPVGAFLSGGLDSSAVVAMARETAPGIDCFTIDAGDTPESGFENDLPYARRVAAYLGVKLHEISVDSSDVAVDLERLIFQLDEPLADPAPLNVLYISQLARKHGIKVLLSGVGGDDLFSGYRRHRALMLERYWSWLPLAARTGLRRTTARTYQGGSFGRRLAKAFANADLPTDERLPSYFLWANVQRILELFAPEHRTVLTKEAMFTPLEKYLALLPPSLTPLDRMLALEQRFFLTDHNLLYTDKMSMALGVEVRVPYLDNDLVKLANGLPAQFKQRGRESKWVLKKAMEPYLPKAVIYRPKAGFGVPLRRWLRNELKDMVGDLLSADSLNRRGLFDPASVARLISDDREGRVEAAYSILGLVCIEIWCRTILDTIV